MLKDLFLLVQTPGEHIWRTDHGLDGECCYNCRQVQSHIVSVYKIILTLPKQAVYPSKRISWLCLSVILSFCVPWWSIFLKFLTFPLRGEIWNNKAFVDMEETPNTCYLGLGNIKLKHLTYYMTAQNISSWKHWSKNINIVSTLATVLILTHRYIHFCNHDTNTQYFQKFLFFLFFVYSLFTLSLCLSM